MPGRGTTTAPTFSPIISSGTPSDGHLEHGRVLRRGRSRPRRSTRSRRHGRSCPCTGRRSGRSRRRRCAQVACVQPPVDERLGGLLGIAPVARDDVLTTDEQFADARHADRDRSGRPRREAPAKPTVSGSSSAYSSGRTVDTEDVSVRPKPLASRAFGKETRQARNDVGCRRAHRRMSPSRHRSCRSRRSSAGSSPARRSRVRM